MGPRTRSSVETVMNRAIAALRRFLLPYNRFFSIGEIESESILQLSLGALLLSVYIGFSRWLYVHAISVSSYNDNLHVCWPYFQGCGTWYVLQALPEGYSQSIVFMGLFAVLCLIAFFMYRKEWRFVHILLTFVWIFKMFVIFVLSQDLASNFDYYELLLLFVVLFLPHKLYFARLTFVLFYFLSVTVKMHDGWILGTYFTSLQNGLPLFGNALAPFLTNTVIFMQIVGCWALLSRNLYLRRTVLGYFMLFHLYSGIFVGYRYPTVSFVMLVVLFAIDQRKFRAEPPLTLRSIAGWCFVALLFVAQFLPIAIRGDQRMTLEGDYYGFFMFEANHQCTSSATVSFADGTTRVLRRESIDSTWRCDPYAVWFALHNSCQRNPNITRIAWQFDHSIDGGPFYRIVDEENVCNLEYNALSHNSWIRLPEEGAVIDGYPVKNYFQ